MLDVVDAVVADDAVPVVVVVPVDETTVPDAFNCSAVFDDIICTLSTVADEIGS